MNDGDGEENQPPQDYVCLAESGWLLVDKIEVMLEHQLDMDQVAEAVGYPKSDLYQLMSIASKNRTDLLTGIHSDPSLD